MTVKRDAAYYGLDANPRNAEEALVALKAIERADNEAYTPDVASDALRYYSVVLNEVKSCHRWEYLNGEVRGKMSVLAGKVSSSFANSPGYTGKFSVAINLMINRSEEYFKYKELFDKNTPYQEIIDLKYSNR